MIVRLASNFDVRVIDDFIVIVDLNLGNKSVTNDIDNIIEHVRGFVDLKDKTVIYRDSDCKYDRIVLNDLFNFDHFRSITDKRCVYDLYDAMTILDQQLNLSNHTTLE